MQHFDIEYVGEGVCVCVCVCMRSAYCAKLHTCPRTSHAEMHATWWYDSEKLRMESQKQKSAYVSWMCAWPMKCLSMYTQTGEAEHISMGVAAWHWTQALLKLGQFPEAWMAAMQLTFGFMNVPGFSDYGDSVFLGVMSPTAHLHAKRHLLRRGSRYSDRANIHVHRLGQSALLFTCVASEETEKGVKGVDQNPPPEFEDVVNKIYGSTRES